MIMRGAQDGILSGGQAAPQGGFKQVGNGLRMPAGSTTSADTEDECFARAETQISSVGCFRTISVLKRGRSGILDAVEQSVPNRPYHHLLLGLRLQLPLYAID